MKVIASFLLIMCWICLGAPASAGPPSHWKAKWTDVVIYDDWPADGLVAEGTTTCAGGELDLSNPFEPFCATGDIELRDTVFFGCMTSDDSRANGFGAFLINGNLDTYTYSGPVWGQLIVIPSENCDARSDYKSWVFPTEYWKGFWWGQRSLKCSGEQCYWVGELRVVSRGYGGELQGLRMVGTEIVTTFTPLPVPWELLPPALGLPGGPEGILKAKIRE